MQAFADGLGGRLPTERGRDIGVSAEVGEATARVLSAVVKTAAGVFDAAATSIALRRSDGGLDYQAAWGAGADEVVGMRLRPGQGIAGRVLATGVGEVIQDCRNDPDFAAAVARGTGYVPYTMIVVPLVPDDVSVGVLTVLTSATARPTTSATWLGRGCLLIWRWLPSMRSLGLGRR
jgi:signal transduction protein with GAF and PtsI domain